MDIKIVLLTAPNLESAQHIAKTSVEKSLAACVSIIPAVTSVYSWEGEIHEDQEVQLIFKTNKSNIEILKNHVLSIHPYDCPELIALPADWVENSYLNWMTSLLKNNE